MSYTMENLRADYDEAKTIVLNAGFSEVNSKQYTIELSNKPTSWFGRCWNYRNNTYKIQLNKVYAETASHKDVITTLVHEFVHSFDNCVGHGKVWQEKARLVSARTGLNITTKHEVTEGTKAYRKERISLIAKTSYTPICQDCGKEFKTYLRKTKIVNSIMNNEKVCYCPYCKSHNLKIRANHN